MCGHLFSFQFMSTQQKVSCCSKHHLLILAPRLFCGLFERSNGTTHGLAVSSNPSIMMNFLLGYEYCRPGCCTCAHELMSQTIPKLCVLTYMQPSYSILLKGWDTGCEWSNKHNIAACTETQNGRCICICV